MHPPMPVDQAVLVTLWSGPLPGMQQLKTLSLLFSCERDGYHLKSLFDRCEDCTAAARSAVPMLLLVSTDHGDVLGAYSPQLFARSAGSYATRSIDADQAFVFSAPRAAPKKIADEDADEDRDDHGEFQRAIEADTPTKTCADVPWFGWSAANQMLLGAGNDGLFFGGGGGGPAIFIDGELMRGSSAACESFASPPGLRRTTRTVDAGSPAEMPADSVQVLPSIDFAVRGLEIWVFN